MQFEAYRVLCGLAQPSTIVCSFGEMYSRTRDTVYTSEQKHPAGYHHHPYAHANAEHSILVPARSDSVSAAAAAAAPAALPALLIH